MHSEPLTKTRRHRARLRGAAALAATLLGATPLSAQFIDLDVQTGAPACDFSVDHEVAHDDTADIDETIMALTDSTGDPVFWVLTHLPGGSTVGCTATAPGGFTTSLDCDNGVTITLPAGADASTSIPSIQGVTVAIDPLVAPDTVGEAAFSLQATLDGGGFNSCEQQYSVVRNEPAEAFDLIFVLDKSGSMGSAAGLTTRWNALRTGVETFLPFVQVEAEPPTTGGSQFGVTFFQSNVDPATAGLTDILSGAGPSTDFSSLPSLLSAQSPGGATAMGQGVDDALGKLTATDRTQVIVLFTDGEQNVDPRVALDGCNFTSPASQINPPDCPATSGVQICTVGIGSPSGVYHDTLYNLANNNRCSMLVTDNGEDFTGDDAVMNDIGATFAATIGEALKGNSPQRVARYGGRVLPDPAAPAPVVLAPFDVNEKVESVMLSFVFNERFETPQLVQLFAGMSISRDGSNVTAEFEPIIVGNFSDVLTLIWRRPDAPGGDLSGTYEVALALPPNFKPDLEFRLNAYVDDARISTDATLGALPVAGGNVDVAVQLDYLNLGIEGADVVVRAFTPGADMGELLSQGGPVDELSSAPDAGNPGVQKYHQLVANDPGFLAQLALSPNAITMTDAGGGLYTGNFNLPDNVGVVHFVYDVAATSPLFGSLQRHWMESAYAGFDEVDLAGSNPAWSQGETGVVLNFRPVRPPSGKLIGPGNQAAFTFDGANVVEITDLQDGRYSYTLDTSDPDTPINVSVFGNTVYDGPVSGWGMGPPRSVIDILFSWPWWLIVVVVLLIILLLILFWRRSANP